MKTHLMFEYNNVVMTVRKSKDPGFFYWVRVLPKRDSARRRTFSCNINELIYLTKQCIIAEDIMKGLENYETLYSIKERFSSKEV